MIASVGGVTLLIIGALALIWWEPIWNRVTCFFAFGGYTILASAFVAATNEWIREPVVEAGNAFATWILNSYTVHLFGFVAILGGCVIWFLLRMARGSVRQQEKTQQTETKQSEFQHTNWVPAKSKPRSMTRRVLRATKLYNPREHWAVKEQK